MAKLYLTDDDKERLKHYNIYEQLYDGDHFSAFSIMANSQKWSREYEKLRYIVVNFAALISKVCADFLYGEQISLKAYNPKNQPFLDALQQHTNLDIGLYEAALSQSYHGDAVFNIRSNNSKLILAPFHPSIYFPQLSRMDIKAEPEVIEKKTQLQLDADTKAVLIERHEPGTIFYELWKLEENELKTPLPLETVGITENIIYTNVDTLLITHIPNPGKVGRFWGISDYKGLTPMMHELNHRITAVEVLLDTFGDPLLLLPKGVMDENGNVDKKRLKAIELETVDDPEPKYITWDANLDSAFREIDKILELAFMTSEISPDVLGMGEGTAESGRALKYKMLRTIAKVRRKRIYHNTVLPETIYKAMEYCAQNGILIDGNKVAEPEKPAIIWQDGIPVDTLEQLEIEEKALEQEITTKTESAKRVWNIDDEEAAKLIKEAKKENKIELPNMTNPLLPPQQQPPPPVEE